MYHVSYDIDEEGDISLESAKMVLVEIINNAMKEGDVGNIISRQEIAPDYKSAGFVVQDFIYKVIPNVTKMLKEMK
jgi:hypothetical protein